MTNVKNIKPLDPLQLAYAQIIAEERQRAINAAEAKANLRYDVLRKQLGVPDGPVMNLSTTPGGTTVAIWDTPQNGPALVKDIGDAGVASSAEVLAVPLDTTQG